MPNSKYQTGIYAGKEYTGSLDLNNPALFEKEQVQEELAGNFEARETVSSGYVRFDQKITDRVELMSGLAYREHQSGLYRTYIRCTTTDITGKTERQRNSYINFLPSLLVKVERKRGLQGTRFIYPNTVTSQVLGSCTERKHQAFRQRNHYR